MITTWGVAVQRRRVTELTAKCAAVLCATAFVGSAAALTASAEAGSTVDWGSGGAQVTTGTNPRAVAVDSAGNVFTVNSNFTSNTVTKISPGGASTVNWGPDGAEVTPGGFASGIAIDSAGNIYTALQGASTVSKISPSGEQTNFGTTGSAPSAIAVDSAGNIYTANRDSNDVTKITPGGESTTLGTTGAGPRAIAVDSAGNVYTANYDSNDVTKITPGGESTTLGTTGTGPTGIALDSAGNVYTANYTSSNVTKITPGGTSTVLASTGTGSFPYGIALDSAGNIYTANNGSNNVTQITPTWSGTADWGPGGSTVSTSKRIGHMTIDDAGNIFGVNGAESGSPPTVFKISPSGVASSFSAGSPDSWGNTKARAIMSSPTGELFVATTNLHGIYKVSVDGAVTSMALGTPYEGISAPATTQVEAVISQDGFLYFLTEPERIQRASVSDPPLWVRSHMNSWGPGGTSVRDQCTFSNANLLTDSNGNIYCLRRTESGLQVRKITPSGVATAGWGPGGAVVAVGDNTYNLAANWSGAAIDRAGNLYYATAGDAGDNCNSDFRVTKVTPAGVATVNWGPSGAAVGGNGNPQEMRIDGAGNLLLSAEMFECTGYTVVSRKLTRISPDGVVSDALSDAGTGVSISNAPSDAIVDAAGNVYYASNDSNVIERFSPSTYPAPPAVPGAPSATAGVGQATVTVPANATSAANGGPYSYTVTAVQDPSKRCVVRRAWSSCIVNGLTAGTQYTFTAKANLASWQTAASAPSEAVTPTGAPDAPTSLSATSGDGSASIAFTPGSENGSAITNYEYSTNNGSTWTTRSPSSPNSPVSINGLTNGTTYQVKLRAINGAGTGSASSAVGVTPAAAPAAPTSLVATPGDGSAGIAFTPGADNGSAITNYEYKLGGGLWTAVSPVDDASPVTITGLSNGTTYSVKLRAVNSAGDGKGAESGAVSVTPATVPDAPTSLSARAGNGSASIAFTPGADNGSAITNYEYKLGGGAWAALSPADTSSPVTIRGLTNGTTYSVKLRAVNGAGDGRGAESSALSVKPVAPVVPPSKPAVAWSASAKAKTVTALITPVAGVSYTLTATNRGALKTGACKNVTVRSNRKKTTRRSCTLRLAKGKWNASVRPAKGRIKGTPNSKWFTFR